MRKNNFKKVLITGSTGFIGACLTYKLIDLHYEVHSIIRKVSNLWRIKNIANKINLHYVDLTDANNLEKLIKDIKPNVIFHLATYGGYSFQNDIKKIIQTNIIGTTNLVNACLKVGFDCFVNTGSSSEYGVKLKPMSETDLLEPYNDYGVSKAFGTLFCQAKAQRDKLPIVTLRLFSPYGYYENQSRLIPSVILSCLLGKNLNLSSPISVRDFIFIEDVLDAYIKVIETPNIEGQIFNIGYGKQHSVGEVVNKIIKLTGSKIQPEWGSISNFRIEPEVWQADISKAEKFLNWKPKYNLEQGLSETIKWFKKNLFLYEND